MIIVVSIIYQRNLFSVEGNSWQIWAISVAVAVVTTISEAFFKLGIDNLTVPLPSASSVFLLLRYYD